MATNEEFAKFILKYNPQNNAVRLALYNYIKNFQDLQAPFSHKTIEMFFRKCLNFEYWRKEATELNRESQYFLKKFSETHNLSVPEVKSASKMQIIEIKNPEDRTDILNKFLTQNNIAKNTTIFQDLQKSVLVTVMPNKGVQVAILNHSYLVQNGSLEPLCVDQFIYYDSHLEPAFEIPQTLDVLPQTTARFMIQLDGIAVSYIQGMTFKKIKSFNLNKLHEDKQIYFTLKKIEGLFIDRTSDPLYMDIVKKLEEALYAVESQGLKAKDFALNAIELGENFYSHAFQDDKMIPHLLQDLKQLLVKKGIWKNSSDLINSLHNTEL